MKNCPNCKAEITGRSNKKFCTPYCKSNYHYEKNKQKESSRFKLIDKQLKLNRRILKNYNKAGKAFVRKERLLKEGLTLIFLPITGKPQRVRCICSATSLGFCTGKTTGEWRNTFS